MSHKHILGQLDELADLLKRNHRAVTEAVDRLSASGRDAEAVDETISMLEEMTEELGEAQGKSEALLEALREESGARDDDEEEDDGRDEGRDEEEA